MTEAAEAAGLVNMVNLTYRNAAAIQTARRMVEAGEIGEVRHVQASYLQSWLTGRHWGDWRTRGALAVAALLAARLEGRARRHRRPHPRLRHLRLPPRTSSRSARR